MKKVVEPLVCFVHPLALEVVWAGFVIGRSCRSSTS